MPPCARRQAGESDIADANTGEFTDGIADSRKHPAHLAVSSFKDGEFHFCLPLAVRAIALVAAAQTNPLRGLGGTVFQIDAPAQNV